MRTRVGWGVEDFCRWVGALNFVLLSLQSPGFELSGRDVRGSGVVSSHPHRLGMFSSAVESRLTAYM